MTPPAGSPSTAAEPSARLGRRDPPLATTQRVGSWELVRPVGEGRLARVYQARPAGASAQDACYAVKVLRDEWRDDPRAEALFRREAQVGRAVSHPHLVSILAAQVQQAPYHIVMPYLSGATLAERLAVAGTFSTPHALWIVRQVAEALEGLFVAGWTHADVKPSNIFLSPTGHVTLLDLGFARPRDEGGSVIDRPVLGTIQYIAPELLTSALRADIRSDIYSLGVTLFELLTGQAPFEGKDLGELAARHRQESPAELRTLAPQVPREVAELVRKMLAKEPLRRPQTPRELIRRLIALEIDTLPQQVPA